MPYKTSSTVLPTVNCLVDLIETPFLVVTLKEIEVVNLERVGFALKNFDMAIVFKDFTREVHRIDAIDSRNLDTIKEWLNSVNIKYYESKMNLNWKPILKTILDDPQKFVEEGGWDFLDLEKSDEEDEEEEESDGARAARAWHARRASRRLFRAPQARVRGRASPRVHALSCRLCAHRRRRQRRRGGRGAAASSKRHHPCCTLRGSCCCAHTCTC